MRYMGRGPVAACLCAAIAFVSCSHSTSTQRGADAGASSLKNRIPPPDPDKYRYVRDARDWQNPYLMVRAMELMRSGSGERRACPRRRCPNQKKQRRIGTPSRKSRSKSGFVGFSLETKHAFAKAPCLSYFIGQRVCESDKLWLAGPHLRMCDRRAVNLQKRVHSSRLLVVSAAIFVYRGLLPRPGRRHDKQEL